MSEYVPTTGRIREAYMWDRAEITDAEADARGAAFDRWLAAHDRAVKAEALREAADDWGDGQEGFPYWWLRDRADEMDATND